MEHAFTGAVVVPQCNLFRSIYSDTVINGRWSISPRRNPRGSGKTRGRWQAQTLAFRTEIPTGRARSRIFFREVWKRRQSSSGNLGSGGDEVYGPEKS